MERINVHLTTVTSNNWHTWWGCPKRKLHSAPKKENSGKKNLESSDHCSVAVIWFITPLWSPACFIAALHHPRPLAKGQFLTAIDKCWRMKRWGGRDPWSIITKKTKVVLQQLKISPLLVKNRSPLFCVSKSCSNSGLEQMTLHPHASVFSSGKWGC